MFETFKQNQEARNEPTNPGRRKALETIGGVGVAALAGVMVTGRVTHEENISIDKKEDLPPPSSESNKNFESTRPELLNHLIETLKSGNEEVFNHSLDYVYALMEEKTTLTHRRNTIIEALADSNDADPLQPFYLLEHDRVGKSLDELSILMEAVEEAVRQSPLYSEAKEARGTTTESGGGAENPSLPDSVDKQKLTM